MNVRDLNKNSNIKMEVKHGVIEIDETTDTDDYEDDLIEIVSKSTGITSYFEILDSMDDADKILDVTELLKETIKLTNGKITSIFSYGPLPKLKKNEQQLRPINCHVCRFTTLKRGEMKNHIARQHHIRQSKMHFEHIYFKAMKNFYHINENKTTILFPINPGENIPEVTKYYADRLIEYREEDIKKNSKIPLIYETKDKLYDMNEENPILGLEYCIKLKSDEIDKYYCVLCDVLLEIDNFKHFLDSTHQDKYIEKNFTELSEYCYTILNCKINDQRYCKKKTREIIVDIYRIFEIKNGFRHLYNVDKNIFNYYQNQYIEKINNLSHYSMASTKIPEINQVNNFIQRCLYMKTGCERKLSIKSNENSTEEKESKSSENSCIKDTSNEVNENLPGEESTMSKLIQTVQNSIDQTENQSKIFENETIAQSEDGNENRSEETEIEIQPERFVISPHDTNENITQFEDTNQNSSEENQIKKQYEKFDIFLQDTNENDNNKSDDNDKSEVTEIMNEKNHIEMENSRSVNDNEISKNQNENLLNNNIERSFMSNELDDIVNSNEIASKNCKNKINIENVVILKTAAVDLENIKIVHDVIDNPIYIYQNNTENSESKLEVNNLIINSIENNTTVSNKYSELNFVKSENITKNSNNNDTIYNSNNTMTKVENNDKSVSSEEVLLSNTFVEIPKISSDHSNNYSSKNAIANTSNSTLYSDKCQFKNNILKEYSNYKITKGNKEIPILSYGPPTDKIVPNTNLRIHCHVCETSLGPQINELDNHINGRKHNTNMNKGILKNPIRCYYKTINENTKVFIDVYAGEHILNESQIKKKKLFYEHKKSKQSNNQKNKFKVPTLNISKKNSTCSNNKNTGNAQQVSEKKINPRNKPKIDNYKIFHKEFAPIIIHNFLDLKIPFRNNKFASIFSFGPRMTRSSARTVNCHLCNQSVQQLADLTRHIKTNDHQNKKNTIKWIDLKKSMKLRYKCEKNTILYFEIWPGENILRVNLDDNEKRVINSSQILSDDNKQDDQIYENFLNQTLLGIQYGIILKENEENSQCFCILCEEYLIFDNFEFIKHFSGERHQNKYINKNFTRYTQQICEKIPQYITNVNTINTICLIIILNIYKKMEQHFGYRKFYTISLTDFKKNYEYFTEYFRENIIHYNDKLNLLTEIEIAEIIDDHIKEYSIAETANKRRQNDLLLKFSPKRFKYDESVTKSSVSFISIFRLLSVVEDLLGTRLGAQVLDVLAQTALCEKNKENLLKLTTNNDIYMLLIIINEKLKGLLDAQLIDSQKLQLVQRLLNEIPMVINLMDEDIRNLNIQALPNNDKNSSTNPINFAENFFDAGNTNDTNFNMIPMSRPLFDNCNQPIPYNLNCNE